MTNSANISHSIRPTVARTVRSGSVELAVFEQGNPTGPTLVLVHGWPDTHQLWEHVVPHLTDRFRVISYDTRGSGRSTVPTALADVGPYATGAYLMAGLEVMDLAGPVQALPQPPIARDDEATILATTPQQIAPKNVVGEAEKARREQEMRATRALAYDPATLQQAPRNTK